LLDSQAFLYGLYRAWIEALRSCERKELLTVVGRIAWNKVI